MANTRVPTNNTSGIKGVYWDARCQKWAVAVEVGGKSYFGGRFSDKVEAEMVMIDLRKRLHGDFTRY
jgi:hypothetical protein